MTKRLTFAYFVSEMSFGTKSENFSCEYIAWVIEAFMQINEYRLGKILVAGESITSDSERANIKHARGEIDDVLLRCL